MTNKTSGTIAAIAPRLRRFAVLALGTTAIGTLGYMLVEGWNPVESLYMTIITISSVGFKEVEPLSRSGQIFTIFLIIIGVGNVAYLFGSIGEFVVGDQLSGTLRRRKMQRSIDRMEGHYIICGFGRVGAQVAEDLARAGVPFVVIEPATDPAVRSESGYAFVEGDGSDDDVLLRAGIERANGLVAAAGNDADNIFITLSARNLNGRLEIVARSNDRATDSKLLRAGANHVISPYTLSGRKIATQLLNPNITTFLDGVMPTGTEDLWLEEAHLSNGSGLTGRTIAEANVRADTGAFIVAVRHSDSTVISNPPASLSLAEGDTLVALGTREQLNNLRTLAAAGDPPA